MASVALNRKRLGTVPNREGDLRQFRMRKDRTHLPNIALLVSGQIVRGALLFSNSPDGSGPVFFSEKKAEAYANEHCDGRFLFLIRA